MEANKEQLQLPGAPHFEPTLDIKQPNPIQDVKALKPSLISSNGKKDQVMTRSSNYASSMKHKFLASGNIILFSHIFIIYIIDVSNLPFPVNL